MKSWKDISVETAEKSFKKWSVLNAMDGTEDMLWLDDDKKDNILVTQLITPENNPFDNQVPAEDWNLLFGASNNDD